MTILPCFSAVKNVSVDQAIGWIDAHREEYEAAAAMRASAPVAKPAPASASTAPTATTSTPIPAVADPHLRWGYTEEERAKKVRVYLLVYYF